MGLMMSSFYLLVPTLCAYGLVGAPLSIVRGDCGMCEGWQGAMMKLRGGGDKIKVRFEARVAHTKPGETVVLLGSVRALRCWNASEAIGLKTSSIDFPWWSTELRIPVGDTVEWKVAIRTPSGNLLWERGPNRRFVVPDVVNHTFAFEFGDQAPAANCTADDALLSAGANGSCPENSTASIDAPLGSHDNQTEGSLRVNRRNMRNTWLISQPPFNRLVTPRVFSSSNVQNVVGAGQGVDRHVSGVSERLRSPSSPVATEQTSSTPQESVVRTVALHQVEERLVERLSETVIAQHGNLAARLQVIEDLVTDIRSEQQHRPGGDGNGEGHAHNHSHALSNPNKVIEDLRMEFEAVRKECAAVSSSVEAVRKECAAVSSSVKIWEKNLATATQALAMSTEKLEGIVRTQVFREQSIVLLPEIIMKLDLQVVACCQDVHVIFLVDL
jgi:hypothetical protein